jgi:(E)-4-hydroxy-3-methyl-but-2-enyl pyrophosphate reductase
MKVIKAKTAGFCYGVKRAVEIAEKAAAEGRCYTLGPLIHNEQAVSRLREKGVCELPSIGDVPEGAVVMIRSHGASEKDMNALREKNCEIIDATCPNVSRIHKILK